ncbi:hypothetical protein RDI58_000624 [Solanum bulbocastanum]|uniref:F-box domain-containing protein n=1 Tax=Solanum bulbocastanum TaxID=147425 RepID=A0AAN8UAS3_SOLBU
MDEKMNYAPKKSSIPQDIIFEICSWLPVKSLMRLKCVSTLCNLIVSESNFLDNHRFRSMGTKFLVKGGEFYYTAEENKDGKASASLLQVDKFNNSYNRAPTYSCFNSCVNGLFCGWRSSSLLIFNPSTKEVRILPQPNKDILWCNYSLGFEPKENKYKVVSTKYHAQEGYIKYWIFTLGIDKTWREIQRGFSCVPSSSPSVCISGVIYQFVYESFLNCYKSAIVAFDVKFENYEIIALWKAFMSPLHYHELIEVKGKLAIIYYNYVRRSGYMDMWILEQTSRKKMERNITIAFP